MLQRALDAKVPFAWVTADEAYGQVKRLRYWLEQQAVAHVLATKVNDTVITTTGGDARVDALIAGLPRQAWKRLSAGPGAHGQRLYDWARVPIRIWWENGFGHWVLARRSLSDPTEIAYYVCHGPVGTRLRDLARVAGARLIPLSVAEIRRLIGLLLRPQLLTPTHHLRWSWWRRLSQTRARLSHYKRRGQTP